MSICSRIDIEKRLLIIDIPYRNVTVNLQPVLLYVSIIHDHSGYYWDFLTSLVIPFGVASTFSSTSQAHTRY